MKTRPPCQPKCSPAALGWGNRKTQPWAAVLQGSDRPTDSSDTDSKNVIPAKAGIQVPSPVESTRDTEELVGWALAHADSI